ncbi:MAG TPA: carboxypeptidase-like regulatory domain-containing protein [Candidatus Rubrimentiphilum sp.]|nr:carboxypeptidase-like regulatory domain-containing protein [Candidatus Rubrimentiphilum sp.]
MKRLLTFPALLLTLAAAPAPLVVGSVRDQTGAPIPGATVAAGGVRTTTAADGTFALQAGGTDAIRISCAYCLPAIVRVAGSEPVVAIVRRYQALLGTGPSQDDLRSLPYGRAESAVSLQPFVVLNDNRAFLPGPRLSDRGASRQGGVILDDGIPNYDIVANVSGLPTMPLFTLRRSEVFSAGETSYYGDQVSGGIFSLSDLPQQGLDAFAIGGKEAAFRAAFAGMGGAYAAATSGNAFDTRARAAAQVQTAIGTDSLESTFLAARANIRQGPTSIGQDMEGFRAQYTRIRDTALAATLVADRAGYDTSSPLTALWTDVAGELNVSSQTRVQVFGDFGFRRSTGRYAADTFGLRVAGTAGQTHLDVGAQTHGDRYDVRAGIGAYTIAYNGGAGGAVLPMSAQAISPSLYVSYDLSPQWNVEVYAGGSFRLPTLLEAYATNVAAGPLPIDRYAQFTQTVSYTDLRRLKISVTSMNESLSSLDNGTVRAIGFSFSWQIAPAISLRAWTLYFNDQTQAYESLLRFGRPAQSGTPGSLWLTYENPSGLRLDGIYRADLLDALPNRHVDASLSAPLADRMRWFVGTERRRDTRYVDAGIRFEGP